MVHGVNKQKTNMAHRALSEQLKDRSMGRYYLALIDYPLKDNSIVEKPIGRNHKNRLKMDIVGDGRYAKSAFYKILEGRASLEPCTSSKVIYREDTSD